MECDDLECMHAGLTIQTSTQTLEDWSEDPMDEHCMVEAQCLALFPCSCQNIDTVYVAHILDLHRILYWKVPKPTSALFRVDEPESKVEFPKRK